MASDSAELTRGGVVLDDEGRDVAGHSADAARLAHVRPGVGVADGMDFQAAVRADCLDALAGARSQRLVVLQPLNLMERDGRENAEHDQNRSANQLRSGTSVSGLQSNSVGLRINT